MYVRTGQPFSTVLVGVPVGTSVTEEPASIVPSPFIAHHAPALSPAAGGIGEGHEGRPRQVRLEKQPVLRRLRESEDEGVRTSARGLLQRMRATAQLTVVPAVSRLMFVSVSRTHQYEACPPTARARSWLTCSRSRPSSRC